MLHETTPALLRALAAARAAAARDADAVQPRHLFGGLLAEPEGRAAVLLSRHGLNTASWQTNDAVTEGDEAEVVAFSPAVESILQQAARLARQTAVDQVCTTDHLLLTILQSEVGLRSHLMAQGLNAGAVINELQSEHDAPLAPDEPLDWDDLTTESATDRIVDACANRAREAVRVVEDYCRFALNDALLSRQCKELRHALTEVFADIPPGRLLAARDTPGDVGTAISTPREHQRASPLDVVMANTKRLQEALRTLEEFAKTRGAESGRRLEALRYRSYTLERAIVLGEEARRRLAEARLYLLVSGSACRTLLEWTIRAAVEGGVDVVQLREKHLTDRDLRCRADEVRRWTHEAGVLFIVNDRPDVARLAGADGVHLGQEDLPVRDARRIVGPDALVGVSTHNLDQLRRAILDGASYVGVGPTFASTTKDFGALAGLDYVRAASAETSLPSFVLGGVTTANVGEVVAAGGRRVAVSAAIAAADDPRAAAVALKRWLTN